MNVAIVWFKLNWIEKLASKNSFLLYPGIATVFYRMYGSLLYDNALFWKYLLHLKRLNIKLALTAKVNNTT